MGVINDETVADRVTLYENQQEVERKLALAREMQRRAQAAHEQEIANYLSQRPSTPFTPSLPDEMARYADLRRATENVVAPLAPGQQMTWSAAPSQGPGRYDLGMISPQRQRVGLTGEYGPLDINPVARGVLERNTLPIQVAVRSLLEPQVPESWTQKPYIGPMMRAAGTPATWLLGPEMGAASVAGAGVLGSLGRLVAGQRGQEVGGYAGEFVGPVVGGPLERFGIKATTRLAETVPPLVRRGATAYMERQAVHPQVGQIMGLIEPEVTRAVRSAEELAATGEFPELAKAIRRRDLLRTFKPESREWADAERLVAEEADRAGVASRVAGQAGMVEKPPTEAEIEFPERYELLQSEPASKVRARTGGRITRPLPASPNEWLEKLLRKQPGGARFATAVHNYAGNAYGRPQEEIDALYSAIEKAETPQTRAVTRAALDQAYPDTETVRLYRGGDPNGVSWTTDKEVAGHWGSVTERDVPKDEILASWHSDSDLLRVGKTPEYEVVLRRPTAATEAGRGSPYAQAMVMPAPAPPMAAPRGTYVAPLRDFDDVVDEVVTTTNPFIKAAVAKTGINPSVAGARAIDKVLTAHSRQLVATEELTKTALTGAIDSSADAVGRLPITVKNGIATNVRVKPGQSAAWGDIFARPGEYSLTRSQRRFVDDVLKLVREGEEMRVAAGLKPRGLATRQGWFYVPRQVKGARGITFSKPSRPDLQRVHEEMIEGIQNGVDYDNIRNTLEVHLRNAYRDVLNKQFSDAVEPLSVTPKQLLPASIVHRMKAAVSARQAAERAAGYANRSLTWWKAGQKWRNKLAYQTAARKAAKEPDLADVTARIEAGRKDVAQMEQRIQYYRGRTSVAQPKARDEKQLTFLRQWLKDTEFHLNEFQQAKTGIERQAKLRVIARDMAKWDARQDDLIRIRDAAEAQLKLVRGDYDATKKAYSRALEAAKHRETAPGAFWGPNQPDEIKVAMWRNRYFPEEDVPKLAEQLGSMGTAVRRPNILMQAVEKTGNLIRFGAAVGDFATPFIHGLPLLFRNPIAWAKATGLHYLSFFDPAVQARYVKRNMEVFQEMAQHGVPIGDPEFFKALEPGGGISLRGVPKGVRAVGQTAGKQTFGRFQATYNTLLGVARAELWKGGRNHWKDPSELAAWVRNMTGGLDSRALAVGPNQRAGESVWGAFSPRLLRSTAALVADATKLGTQRGRESARALLSLAAGATGIYVLTGMALGKTDEEIKQGLNPLNGKKFLAHQINGDWIGVGGQVRAMVQLAAKIIADPAAVTEQSIYDNPLAQFYSSRGAPGTKVVGAVGEALTKGKVDLLPYEQIDGPVELFKHLGSSFLPFTIQGLMEGENPETAIASFLGARTQAESTPEKRKRISLEEKGIAYEDMTDAQMKKDFRESHRELFSTSADYAEGTPEYRRVKLQEDKMSRITALGEQLKREEITPKEYIAGRSDILAEISNRMAEYPSDYESENPQDKAVSEWVKIIQEEKSKNPSGLLTGEGYDAAETRAKAQLGPEKWALVENWRLASSDPVEKQYLADRAKMEPYFDRLNPLWQDYASHIPELRPYAGLNYEQYVDEVVIPELAAENMGPQWVERHPVIKAFQKFAEMGTPSVPGTKPWLWENPEADALLAIWEYTDIVHSQEAADIFKSRTGYEARPPVKR